MARALFLGPIGTTQKKVSSFLRSQPNKGYMLCNLSSFFLFDVELKLTTNHSPPPTKGRKKERKKEKKGKVKQKNSKLTTNSER
jgi:hypothetical protein